MRGWIAYSADRYSSEHDTAGGDAAAEAATELYDLADDPEAAASSLWPKYDELVAELDRRIEAGEADE